MLRCGELPVLIPFADNDKCEGLLEGERSWFVWMVGGANRGPEGGVKGGGVNLVSGLRSGVEGVIPTEYPVEKLGWSAIVTHM